MKDIRSRFNIKKNNFNFLVIILIVITCSLLSSVITGVTIYFVNNKNVILGNEEKELLDTFNNIKSSFYKNVDASKIKDAAINGMLNYLGEDYSELLNSEDNDNLSDKLNGKYHGIGVTLNFNGKFSTIIEVHDESPAAKADIKVGDVLISIDGEEITRDNYSKLSDLLKDKRKIKVVIARNDEKITKNVDVKTILKPSVNASMISKDDKKIGYIYVETFSSTTDIQFKSALKNLENEGMDSLIIDLRSNTGGYLDVAHNIASMFIYEGKPIYQLENKDKKEIIYDDTKEARNYDIVVITNQITASASEILALALKESYGAIIVGAKTYGKGRVQQIDSLSNNEKVKFTIANWYSPLGNSIDGIGITPGVHVELDQKYALSPSTENDTQLQKALEILTN